MPYDDSGFVSLNLLFGNDDDLLPVVLARLHIQDPLSGMLEALRLVLLELKLTFRELGGNLLVESLFILVREVTDDKAIHLDLTGDNVPYVLGAKIR